MKRYAARGGPCSLPAGHPGPNPALPLIGQGRAPAVSWRFLTALFLMPCLWIPPELPVTDNGSAQWNDNTRDWFPRVDYPAASGADCAGVPGPGDEDDEESDGGVGNIDPEEDEGYDDGDEDDDDEEDTLWASPAASSSPPNRA